MDKVLFMCSRNPLNHYEHKSQKPNLSFSSNASPMSFFLKKKFLFSIN